MNKKKKEGNVAKKYREYTGWVVGGRTKEEEWREGEENCQKKGRKAVIKKFKR